MFERDKKQLLDQQLGHLKWTLPFIAVGIVAGLAVGGWAGLLIGAGCSAVGLFIDENLSMIDSADNLMNNKKMRAPFSGFEHTIELPQKSFADRELERRAQQVSGVGSHKM
jgi:hypothetical protein